MHGYLCSTIFEYCRSVFDDTGFDARDANAGCYSDEAMDMMLVLRYCTMAQACLTRRMNLSGPHNYCEYQCPDETISSLLSAYIDAIHAADIDKDSSSPRSSPGRISRQSSSPPAASYGGTEDE